MKALILAAGRGSRMENMTDDNLKCLTRLRGKPLLEWQLSALKKAGIEDIGIVTGYRQDLLDDYDFTKFHNERWASTNMVSSLECAAEWLACENCIVSYSDIFYESSAIELLLNSPAQIAITYDPHWLSLWGKRFDDPLIDAESFRIDQNDVLLEIGNKPRSIEEVQGQYMGLLKFTPKAWTIIEDLRRGMAPEERDKMHCTGTLQAIISGQNMPITTIKYTGKWGEIDTVDDLKLYEENHSLIPT